MKTEMTLQQALDMANSAHASRQEKVLVVEIGRLAAMVAADKIIVNRLLSQLGLLVAITEK